MADAPSPEEWPKHGGGSTCRDLDGAVRCPICGDPFETPLSLRCGHAFCSGCVRSSIEYQERSGPASCPQCRDRCDAADLRPAPQLRAIAAAFLAARPLLLESVRAALAAMKDPAAAVPSTQPQGRSRSRQRRQQPAQQEQRSGRRRLRNQSSLPLIGNVISVELSSGSEDDTPAAKPQAARRRQQPKRGRSASAAQGEDADASQSTGSGKRQQLSSPSDVEAQAGRQLLRSTSRAAASAPMPADGGSASDVAKADTKPGSRKAPAAADTGADAAVDGASDSDPEYLGEQHPSSSDDEATTEAAAAPASKQPPACERLPIGHVRCPNCAKMLPQAFINSHLDSCLTGGKGSGGGGGGGWGISLSKGSTAPAKAQLNGVRANGSSASGSMASGFGRAAGSSGAQLKVPPKLCVALLSDKAMRDTCKSFGLPTTGRKEVLAERYSRFRLEVQTANDTGAAASYADCVRRVQQRESRTAKAAFGAPLSRTAAASSPAAPVGESSFEELIRATRQRHAAQRAAAAAAAATPDASTAAPSSVQPEPAARAAAPNAAKVSASAAAAAEAGAQPALGTAGLAQPATAEPTDGAARPADGRGGLPAAQGQPAADLGAWGSHSGDAAAAFTALAADVAGSAHPAAQPLLDEQSRSASRSLETAAVLPQYFHSCQPGAEAAAGGRQYPGGGAAADAMASGTALRGDVQQDLREHLVAQQGAAGHQQGAEAALQVDADVGRGSLDAALPAGMSCTQQPAQLGPALSCGQQLQMQLQFPFTFDAAFSDDSRSCPLSPSV